MQVLVLAMLASDLLLGVGCLVLLIRPRYLHGLAGRLVGARRAGPRGDLAADEALEPVLDALRLPALLLLLAWSFACGATATWWRIARLDAARHSRGPAAEEPAARAPASPRGR